MRRPSPCWSFFGDVEWGAVVEVWNGGVGGAVGDDEGVFHVIFSFVFLSCDVWRERQHLPGLSICPEARLFFKRS